MILLCSLDNQVAERHATASKAVAWAMSALPSMTESPVGTWTQRWEGGLGYVEAEVDEDGTSTIRIRPDASSTDDDVVLVEDPRRRSVEPLGLRERLAAWSDAFAEAKPPGIDHMDLQRRQAAVIAAVVDATASGGGRSYVIRPPSLHESTEILTAGSLGPAVIPGEEALCAAADEHLGGIAWLSVMRTSGCEVWKFLLPSSHAFTLPAGGPDPVAAIRAHSELLKGLPFGT